MEQSIECNVVNTLYYLFFGGRELVHYFERIWTDDGMRFRDEEYAYVFLGWDGPRFSVDLEAYYFLSQNGIIETTGGNEHESIYVLTEYYHAWMGRILKEKKHQSA